jgi:hypothetical protein
MADFVTFGKQTVNVGYIVRADWEVATSGRSVQIHIYLNDGHHLVCPFDDPNCKKFADLLGFGDRHAAWPKEKAAADAAFAKQQAEAKAKQDALRQRRFQPA